MQCMLLFIGAASVIFLLMMAKLLSSRSLLFSVHFFMKRGTYLWMLPTDGGQREGEGGRGG